MIYADYHYYTETYQGNQIPQDGWDRVAQQSSAYLDRLTYGRLQRADTVTNAVKNAVCAVAEVFFRYQAAEDQNRAGILSENVDGYSVSYAGGMETSSQQTTELYHAAGLYLSPGDPLRHAGVLR